MINIVSFTKGIFSLLDTDKYTSEIMIYMRLFFFFNIKKQIEILVQHRVPFHTNHIDHIPRINSLKCLSVKWQKLKTIGVIVNLYIEKFRPDGLIKWVGIQTQLIQILLQEIHVIFLVLLIFVKKKS